MSQYLLGKFEEMEEEIFPISNLMYLNLLKKDHLRNLKNMNNSLLQANFIEALKVWKQYDENGRLSLINELINIVEAQNEKINKLESFKIELGLLKEELETLESEYNLLDETYIVLSNTYQKVNTELNSTKKNLTTSITAIFLVAIIFYFLGHQGVGRWNK
jgi:archaellum component FlaC